MAEGYFYNADWKIVRGDDASITETWTNATTGAAINISAWVFTFEANERNSKATTPGNIRIDNAAVLKTDSGTGITDTNIIPFSGGDTDVNEGRYDYDITANNGGAISTYARGTLTILPSEQD